MDITKKKVIFIDLDDTLISTRTGNKFPAGIWDMKLNLPVFDQLKKLHPLAVLIASNQGGIELGIVPQQLFEPKFIYVIASLQEYTTPIPGVIETIGELKKAGIKIGSTTVIHAP